MSAETTPAPRTSAATATGAATALPTLFLSHGSPMLSLLEAPARSFLEALGPRADAAAPDHPAPPRAAAPVRSTSARGSSRPAHSGHSAAAGTTARSSVPAAFSSAALAFGLMPNGFSFDASLMMDSTGKPSSRATSVIGLPG